MTRIVWPDLTPKEVYAILPVYTFPFAGVDGASLEERTLD